MSTLNGQNNEHEHELLRAVEQIVHGGTHTAPNPHSPLGVAARLAATVPQPDAAFADQLEARLVAAAQQRKEATMGTTETQRTPEARRLTTTNKRRASVWQNIRWMGVGIATLTLLSAFVPPFRSAVVQATDTVRAIVGMSGGPGQFATFSPDPAFVVQQPKYVPTGLELTAQEYWPGNDVQTGQALPAISGGVVRNTSAAPSASISSMLPAFSTLEVPYIMLEYAAQDGNTFRIVERAAQPNEMLPAGEARAINQHTATLTSNYQLPVLTWINRGTWIELQGTLPENELVKIAESFVPTQRPNPNSSAPVVVFLPPTPVPAPVEPLLGTVLEQQFHFQIVFAYADDGGYGLSAQEAHDQMPTREETHTWFGAAVVALRDTSIPAQRIAYSETFNPPTTQYIIVEVWDEQVNIGTTSDDASIREQAAAGIENYLQDLR